MVLRIVLGTRHTAMGVARFGIPLTQRLGWSVLLQDALTLLCAPLLFRSSRTAAAPAHTDRKGVRGGAGSR
ncbi:hypothetical protein [Streptomyces sp. WMMC940]|uniref:hypothetical protein n=1 Tax=Streptomyces sp. WMMC940 TaxID=3015153 RepID=UPI0022B72333|nr:hypothetical protein [Streptomyces sp. WMMC940]MCZ7456440.1 hypothetical protein [Streptomyces sp. WMMC940]